MRDGTRIGKVVDARQLTTSHLQRDRQQVVQDRHGIGNIDDLGILGDLGDEAAMVQVIRDRHAKTQGQDVGIVADQLSHTEHAIRLID